VSADADKVRGVIRQVLEHVNKSPDELTDDTPLYGEGLGLDSLEAAELSATLEDEFGSDPWSAGDEMPETVGEIVAFYEAA
jgi:acyl carrier protein